MVAIVNGRIITPFQEIEQGVILIAGGRIAALGPAQELIPPVGAKVIDAGGNIVAPGFIDVHIHGTSGYDVMEASREGLRAMAEALASQGTTGFLPTTMTASQVEILAVLQTIGQAAQETTQGAKILGAHLEGPYLNPKNAGAQPLEYIRSPSLEEFDGFLAAYEGLTLLTLAPEQPGALELVSYAHKKGVTVSIGHSEATYETVLEAVKRGLTHATHTFCGMKPMHHRDPGPVGAVLSCDEIQAELIADNIHLHPAVVKILVRAKGVAGVVLVTDSSPLAGLPDGKYQIRTQEIRVQEGVIRTAAGRLAGSALSMDRAVKNVLEDADLSLAQAIQMATYNPARSISLEASKGSLTPGKDADLVVLDENLKVYLTIVSGRIVHRA